MPIPDYQTVMLPLLRFLADNGDSRRGESVESMAEHFTLSDDERTQMLPSGKTTVIRNRVGWALSYMKQAGLIEYPKRGLYRVTSRGRTVLAEGIDALNVKYLERFPEFVEFKQRSREKNGRTASVSEDTEHTPEEALDNAYERLRSELESELLDQVKAASPAFFERLVIDLLVGMGYGGSLRDAGQAVGRSGDGGIDGIIKEDRLGLDVIYVQAKRWDNTVGRPEIQKFAGALQGRRARKGVFITTAGFTKEARDYANMIETRIVLIDGEELVGQMIDHDIGVSPVSRYDVKRVDSDYFIEE